MGIPNAKVLPEPVEALPMTFCPCRIPGIAKCWIGVGSLKCSFASEPSTSDERSRECQADTKNFQSTPL